jgi:hypothetical protein
MEKWGVLPTDPRYTDLTEEQMDLLYYHYERTIPGKWKTNDNAGVDEEGPEYYFDPDFDSEWNAEDEDGISDSTDVGENYFNASPESSEEGDTNHTNLPKSSEDDGEWQEV